MGITPDYAVSVMYFDPQGKIKVGGEGGGVPATIFHDAMAPILAGQPNHPFPRADPAVAAGTKGGGLLAAGAAPAPRPGARAARPRSRRRRQPAAGQAPGAAGRRRDPGTGGGAGGPRPRHGAGSAELAAHLRGHATAVGPAGHDPFAAPMTLPMSFMPDAPVRVMTSATIAARSASSSWAGR